MHRQCLYYYSLTRTRGSDAAAAAPRPRTPASRPSTRCLGQRRPRARAAWRSTSGTRVTLSLSPHHPHHSHHSHTIHTFSSGMMGASVGNFRRLAASFDWSRRVRVYACVSKMPDRARVCTRVCVFICAPATPACLTGSPASVTWGGATAACASRCAQRTRTCARSATTCPQCTRRQRRTCARAAWRVACRCACGRWQRGGVPRARAGASNGVPVHRPSRALRPDRRSLARTPPGACWWSKCRELSPPAACRI
jgi:hypothetical protein